jgi:hypothetical protein
MRLSERLDEIESAVALARGAQGETRRLLLAAARSTLGAIDERFRLPGLERDREALRTADRALESIRLGRAGFDAWDRTWPARRRLLLGDERRSLFSPAMLREALARR